MNGAVLVGSLSQGNLGDEAMLRAAKARYGSKPHVVLSRDLGRFRLFKLWDLFRNRHGLIFIGGSLLQNVTSNRSLFYYVALIVLARLAKTEIIFEGQGWGPFTSTWSEALATWALGLADRVELRDVVAFNKLGRSGTAPLQRKGNLTLGVDPAFRMPVKIMPYLTLKRSVGFVLRPHASLDEHAKAVLLDFCRSLISRWGKKLIFIPLARPEDDAVCRWFAEQLSACDPAPVWVKPERLEDALQILSEVELLFSMRYHGCVFSEWLHGSYIGLSYDPKVAHHCELYRRPFLNMQSLKLDDLNYLWGQMNMQLQDPVL